jgi:hypothetical protein
MAEWRVFCCAAGKVVSFGAAKWGVLFGHFSSRIFAASITWFVNGARQQGPFLALWCGQKLSGCRIQAMLYDS